MFLTASPERWAFNCLNSLFDHPNVRRPPRRCLKVASSVQDMGRNNYHACWELVGFKRTLWSEVPRPPCSAGAQRRFVNQLPIDRQAVKPWQVLIERTLPDPEDVMAFAA